MERMRWIFELIDRASGPAKNVGGALRGVLDSLEKLRRSGSSDPFRKPATSFERFVNTLHDGLGVIKMVGGALGWVGGKVKNMAAFSIEMLAFKETAIASMDLVFKGDKAKSDAMFAKAVRFGELTPFSTKSVIGSFQQLLGAGFGEKEVPILFQGLGDLAAAGGFDEGIISGISRQLAQVRSKGYLQQQDFSIIAEWAGQAGIGQAQILQAIAKRRGKGVSEADVRASMSTRGVSAQEAVLGLMNAIRERGGGEVGSIMLRMSNTLHGKWNRLKSLAEDFWMKIPQRAENMAVVQRLKGTMDSIIDTFADPARVDRISAVMDKALTGLVEGLFGNIDQKGLGSVIDQVLARVEKVDWKAIGSGIKEGLSDAFAILKGMAEAIGTIASAFNWTGTKLGGAASWISDLWSGEGDFNPAVSGFGGSALRNGLTLGMAPAWEQAVDLKRRAESFRSSYVVPDGAMSIDARPKKPDVNVGGVTVNVNNPANSQEVVDEVSRRLPGELGKFFEQLEEEG